MLAVVQTHPVQYHAPVFRALRQQFAVPITAVYASDFSVAGYRDREFGTSFAWDTDLLSGYESVFLSRVSTGGAKSFEEVSSHGVAAALDSLRPSVVMVSGYRPHLHRAAFFHSWTRGYPVVFRAETTDDEPRSTLKSAARRVALKALYSRCQRLLYIGARSRRHFENLGFDDDRLVFSPYCADPASFQPNEGARHGMREPLRRRLNLTDDRLAILVSGKLSPRKRPDLVTRAAVELHRSTGRSVALVFLGDGEMKGELERTLRDAPEVSVHFAGFKNQTELSPFYHAADLLVLASDHSETWGVVVNEALCHGLPCVVSDRVGCAPDLVVPGRTGDVFDAGSVASLQAAIVRASSLANRSDVRDACRTLANQYSVERAAAGIARAYESVRGETTRH